MSRPTVEIQSGSAPLSSSNLAEFERSTSLWGPITMFSAMCVMFIGPVYLSFFGDFDINFALVFAAVLAIAAIFGVFWLVEPISYFPILGPAAMYQAFLVGNISTKLLPSAITAQNRIGAEPGTARGEITSVTAISAAGIVHVASLAIFVGGLGSWLLEVVPTQVLVTVTEYVAPAILGSVVVQIIIVNLRRVKLLVIGAVVSGFTVFVLVPIFPALGMVTILLGVGLTIGIAVLVPDKKNTTSITN